MAEAKGEEDIPGTIDGSEKGVAKSGAGSRPQSAKTDPTAGMSDADAEQYRAAVSIQGLFLKRRARNRLRDMLGQVFEKVYDESTGAFYYYNKRTGESSWTKPKVMKDDEDVELTPRSKAALESSMKVREEEESKGGGSTRRTDAAGDLELGVQEFLSKHGLSAYAEDLIENGFEDMDSLVAIEEADMEEIGMKRGHQRKLRKQLMAAQGLTYRSDSARGSRLGSARTGDSERSGDPKLYLDLSKKGIGGGKASDRSSARSHSQGGSRRGSTTSGRSSRSGSQSGVVARRKIALEDEEEPPDIPIETLFDGDNSGFPEEGQIVRVHYTGRFMSGKTFEASRARGRPFQFKVGVGQVIEGWDIAIMKMSRGQRAVFTVPPDLAYGVEGRPPVIPPSCPLEFEVELIDFFEPDVELTPRSEYDPEIDGTPRDEEEEEAV